MNIITKLSFAFLLMISFPGITISQSHQDANEIVKKLQRDFGECNKEVKVSIVNNKLMLFGIHIGWLMYQDLTIPLDRMDIVEYRPEFLIFRCEKREGDCIEEEISWLVNRTPVPYTTINFHGLDCNFEMRESIANRISKLVELFP